MKLYDHKNLDAKWQDKWEKNKLYETPRLPGEKKVYVLDMFPYPSGEGLHVGHPKGYIATDIYSRFKRMNGFDVLHPMGWDAFGLPAEQYAIKNKIHPKVAVEKNVAMFKQQLSHLGLSYDWSREIDTTDPNFYKWTQWIFTKLYEKGLAYESNEPINWCPKCKTGLANEDLDGDKCERCESVVEKKPIRQWVLKITDYADRMLSDLDTLNWPEGVKTAQKNWIGRSEGSTFRFALVRNDAEQTRNNAEGIPDSVEIFTTRADTLYGATYIAISAEMAKTWLDAGWETNPEVAVYVNGTLEEQKKETDYSVIKEKTGIFSGIYAVNPVNSEKIPVWIANYVMGGVGTGAIMAVPAHDERDYEFATKYNLPIKQVVVADINKFNNTSKSLEALREIQEVANNENVKFWILGGLGCAFYSRIIYRAHDDLDFITKDEENYIKLLQILEKLGYFEVSEKVLTDKLTNVIFRNMNGVEVDIGRNVSEWGLQLSDFSNDNLMELQGVKSLVISKRFITELKKKQLDTRKMEKDCIDWEYLHGKNFTEDGILINSKDFDGFKSGEAREKIIKDFGGKKVVKYKIQDWVFARQRYWGEPFPVVRDENGKVYMVDESELPVLLPNVESYEPTDTGESPLAVITDWVNVNGYITDKGTFKQSVDGKVFTRETNTMPQWAGSSWYYLRFADPENSFAPIDSEIEKSWLPVDVYVGGDHATRHLIYARFWHKFLYDIGVVSTIEPFSRLEFLGFILAEDGRKMSKRWGNIINPDDVVSEYGADTLRVYEMFMAPFEQTAAWSTSSIKGSDKFLDRVFALQTKIGEKSTVTNVLHRTIKKVTEDIESFKFNTAISQMMILTNSMEDGEFTKDDYSIFLQILAPFAPHITEEIWSKIGNITSVHTQKWPSFDEKYLVTNEVTIAIQISGKMRGTIITARDLSDDKMLELVKTIDIYRKYVGESIPKKVIVIPNRLINIII